MAGERVDVLRLGYRLGRDPRITTHLALVGRALGANRFLLAGDEDPKMFENLDSVASRFGGGMECEHVNAPMGWLRRFVEEDAGDGSPGIAVHLTMYGEPFREAIPFAALASVLSRIDLIRPKSLSIDLIPNATEAAFTIA